MAASRAVLYLHPSSSSSSSSFLEVQPTQPFCLPVLATHSKSMAFRVAQPVGRRVGLFWFLVAGSGGERALAAGEELLLAQQQQQQQLVLAAYVDEKEGFGLQVPVQWMKVQKAGATALFEDPTSKANNIGVVVNPVRISSLREFGSPQTVAEKIVQIEKRKPSTNDVQLIHVKERELHGGIPLYELEYKLDSTRDTFQSPLLQSTASALQQVIDSFDVLQ